MAEKETLNFDLPPELYAQIKAEADRLSIPIAGFMRMLAVQYFEKSLKKILAEMGDEDGNRRENTISQ